MNEKIFEILEYDRIRQMLEKFATSGPGRELCRRLMPETEIETISYLMDETTAARERIRHKGRPSFAKVTNLDYLPFKIDGTAYVVPVAYVFSILSASEVFPSCVPPVSLRTDIKFIKMTFSAGLTG